MTLYFVRHGETDWNVKKKIQGKTDIPLNMRGMEQARHLAGKLRQEQQTGILKVGHVYTSPQLRAVQTAETIAEALSIPCDRIDKLIEMDLGEWEGLNWGIIKEKYKDTYEYWNSHRRFANTPGGESYNQVLKRTLEAMEEIIQVENKDVLVVSHSAVIMTLRCYLAGLPFDEGVMVRGFKTRNTEMIAIDAEEIQKARLRFDAGQ